ncbi:hypothetical protein MNBD_GAMMA01-2284, partial [hydrothermal vent metagenome]
KNNSDGSRLFLKNENTFRFWLNKTAYPEGASAYRVTWLAVTNNTGEHLSGRIIRPEPGAAPDAAAFIAADTTANRNEGKNLWDNKTLIARPGEGNIRAKCMDCHTKTGYDLKYFGYTNESIYKRSRFHGFSDIEAKRLTRYIRNLATPSYGRPWNPPYQPGEVSFEGNMVPLSSRPVERWAAGVGSWRVLKEDKDMLNYVFPDTNNNGEVDQEEVDEVFQLSQINPGANYLGISLIDTPIHLQLPDWNRWLPRVHPVDIWPDFKSISSVDACPDDSTDPDPYDAYMYLSDTLGSGALPSRMWEIYRLFVYTSRFSREGATRDYGVRSIREDVRVYSTVTPPHNHFRSASEGNSCRLNADKLTSLSSAPYREEMFDEYAKRALTHWMGVKYFEIQHVGGLEDRLHEVIGDPALAGERGWPNIGAAVFQHAPHKTARNARYWEGRTNTYDPENLLYRDGDDQTLVEGDYTSAVWYHLEAILNSGNKLPTGAYEPVDWAYNYTYFHRLGVSSGQSQTMMYVATLIKNWQIRDITQGDGDEVENPGEGSGTNRGLNLRTMVPSRAYLGGITEMPSVPDNIVTMLNAYSPNLYRYFLNTALKRWMQIVKHRDFPYRYSTNSALNKLDRWPRSAEVRAIWSILEPETYKPTDWSGGTSLLFGDTRNTADNCWRLLPLLGDEGVDWGLRRDYKNWCKAAWPGPAGNLNDWDSRL